MWRLGRIVSYRSIAFLVLGLVLVGVTQLVARPGPTAIVQPFPSDPSALAVDPRTGHTFVALLSPGPGPGAVAMLDTRSGTLLRTVPVGYNPSALAVATRAGRVFVLNSDPTVSVLDAVSGAPVRTLALRALPYALAVDERAAQVFLDTADGGLEVLSARTGVLLHSLPLGGHPGAIVVDPPRWRVVVSTDTATQEQVVVLDARHGHRLHTIVVGTAPGKEGAEMALDERSGQAFVAQPLSGRVSLLDVGRGRILGVLPVAPGDAVGGILALAGRLVVVGADGASVAVLDARTGRLLRTEAVGPLPADLTPAAQAGRVLVVCRGATTAGGALTGPGYVAVLDVRAAAVRLRPVGGVPVAVAADSATGRIIVANRRGLALPGASWVPGWLRRWLPFLAPSSPPVPPGVSLLPTPR